MYENKSRYIFFISALSALCGIISYSLAFYYIHLYSTGQAADVLENKLIDAMLSSYIVSALVIWYFLYGMDRSFKYYKILNYHSAIIFIIGIGGNFVFITNPEMLFIFGSYSLIAALIIAKSNGPVFFFGHGSNISSTLEVEKHKNEKRIDYTVSKLLYKKDSTWILKNGVLPQERPISGDQATIARKILSGRVSVARTIILQTIGVSILFRLLHISIYFTLMYFAASIILSLLLIYRKIDFR